VDRSTSLDPVIETNTFIFYYSYGSVLGLALDFRLRQNKLNLDDLHEIGMAELWEKNIPIIAVRSASNFVQYAGREFSEIAFLINISITFICRYEDACFKSLWA